MKKGKLINSEISYEIAKMGHTNGLTIGDSGLPIPINVKCIDLALTEGVPSFLDVLNVIIEELFVEEVFIANEMKEVSPRLFEHVQKIISVLEEKQGKEIRVIEVAHNEFKEETKKSNCIIRTGEFTPFANIILKSGVVF